MENSHQDNDDESLDSAVTWTGEDSPNRADDDASVFAPGTVISGRYRIDAYLASGGMGQVYRAHDLTLDVPLAVKTIRPDIASNPASLRLFKQEVLLARSVNHPNVCRIFDLWQDEDSGVTFLTMELLAGETLASRIETRGALSAEESLPLVREMAEALDAAHRASIVHRDFKSANVMVVPKDDGIRAVITDFGLAVTFVDPKRPGRHTATTTDDTELPTDPHMAHSATPGIVGTPAYMSPEQVTGGPVGPASDLYALGVVLFEMRTGQLPFHGSTPLETAKARLTSSPPSPRALGEVGQRWERTILRLLAKNPGERFGSGNEVVLALEGQDEETHAFRHYIPPEVDAFVGRAKELELIARSLEGAGNVDPTRLLTLQGPGGTGKTRLVQKYGWESLSRWPGGVWFCDLSEARSADGIAVAVATSLNIPLGQDDPAVQLGNAIAGRGKCLFILDNFEQVVEHAPATIGQWLERTTSASFLVTSQERLQLHGETTQELEPLDPTTQGVELFEVRAKAHRPGFEVSDSTRPQVESIVRRLDGLPLAIELAASRLRVLNLDQLGHRLRDRFKILAGGKKGRHATLRNTLDWSWELLQPWEQSAMLQVSIFEGGFTLEAAEEVVDLSSFEDDPFVLDVIQSLVDKSWLRARVVMGAPRFEMYTTVHEYTNAKQRSDASTQGLELRHGRYFAEMGSPDYIEGLSRHGGVDRLNALQLELDNLVSACRRAVDRKDEQTAASTYVATHTILTPRGPLVLSSQLGEAVLECVAEPMLRAAVLLSLARAEGTLGKIQGAREHSQAAMEIYRSTGDRSAEARALNQLGALHRMESEMEEAKALGEKALAIHRETGNRDDEGNTLLNLGSLYLELGVEVAREYFEAALDIHRAVGNRAGEADDLAALGNISANQGRLEEGRERLEVSLAIYRELGDRAGEGRLFGNLGNIHRIRGNIAEACENFDRGLAIHREIGDRRQEVVYLVNLGTLHMELFQMEEAREEFEEALVICREIGNRNLEGCALFNLGNVHLDEGRTTEAREHFEAALTIHREVGNRRFEGAELGSLGNLLRDRGQADSAREHYVSALAIHREVGNRSFEGVVLADVGLLDMKQGDPEGARKNYEAALEIHREVGEPRREGIVLTNLGGLHQQQGRDEDARDCYVAALAIHREVGNRNFEGVILGGLGGLHAKGGRVDEARRSYGESIAILQEFGNPVELVKVLVSLGELEFECGNLETARTALAEADSAESKVAPEAEPGLAGLVERLRKRLAD